MRTNLIAPELVTEFIREVHAEQLRQRVQVNADQTLLEKRLKQTEQQLEGLVTAISEGLRGASLQARMDALEAEKATLQMKKQPGAVILLHPNLASIYRKKVEDLHLALNQPEQRDAAFAALRSLIERVEVKRVGKTVEIELIGEIATMV